MGILGIIAGAAIFVIILAIGFYIAEAIILNSLNKKMYGKGTALAWIPICNIYLLGKLTINKIVGWVLVALSFLTAEFTMTINGLERTYSILPDGISSFVKSIYNIGVFGLFIYAIVKNVQLKKSLNNGQTNQNSSNDANISASTPMDAPVQNESVAPQMEASVQNESVAPQMEEPVQNESVTPQMDAPVQSESVAPQMPNQNQQNAFNMKPDNNGQN